MCPYNINTINKFNLKFEKLQLHSWLMESSTHRHRLDRDWEIELF